MLSRAPENQVDPSLEAITALMELMGDPQRAIPVVHITGTNGKTSTARMIERAAARVRPAHRTVHQPAPDRRHASASPSTASRSAPSGSSPPATTSRRTSRSSTRSRATPVSRLINYFEVLTAMAFAAFADAPVDVAVVEVGHRRHLGRDQRRRRPGRRHHADRARPRAAPRLHASSRSRPRRPASSSRARSPCSAQQPLEAAEVLLRRAAEVDATVAREGLEFGVAVPRGRRRRAAAQPARARRRRTRTCSCRCTARTRRTTRPCALAAVEAFLGGGASEPARPRRGAGRRSPAWTRPGRLEVVRRSPTVLVDAAHNPAGAQALAEARRTRRSPSRRLVGRRRRAADKDARGHPRPPSSRCSTRSWSPGRRRPRAMDRRRRWPRSRVEVFGDDRVQVVAAPAGRAGRWPSTLAERGRRPAARACWSPAR